MNSHFRYAQVSAHPWHHSRPTTRTQSPAALVARNGVDYTAPMTPYLQVIAQEWMARAEELAQWAYAHMVNRTDVWGSYLSMEKRRAKDWMFFTAPFPAARGKQFLTKGMLAKHFCGLDGHLVSLHSTSADKTSRWLAIDIDKHDQDEAVSAENNFAAAKAWHDVLQKLGFDPLLMDSNGNGGFHVLIVFSEPVPTADVFAFGQQIVGDWEKRGLAKLPETYPKQVSIEEGHFGNCLRLFGRHHTREHFTRVWSGDGEGETEGEEAWLEGNSAIDRILTVQLARPELIPRNLPLPEKNERPTTTVSKKQRPRVCVDLDEVLAQYDGWKGLDFTGLPIPGAVEFTRKLSEMADIVIFTSRCCVEGHREALNEPNRPASDLAPRLAHNVRYWLEKYDFTFSEIYVGQGKPFASAYVDDRAVSCTPQTVPQAFSDALEKVRKLCGNTRQSAPKPAEPATAPVDPQLQAIIAAWGTLTEKQKSDLVKKAQSSTPKRAKKTT